MACVKPFMMEKNTLENERLLNLKIIILRKEKLIWTIHLYDFGFEMWIFGGVLAEAQMTKLIRFQKITHLNVQRTSVWAGI